MGPVAAIVWVVGSYSCAVVPLLQTIRTRPSGSDTAVLVSIDVSPVGTKTSAGASPRSEAAVAAAKARRADASTAILFMRAPNTIAYCIGLGERLRASGSNSTGVAITATASRRLNTTV